MVVNVSILAAVPTASLAMGRVFNVLLDQRVIDDSGETQDQRTFVILTSAISPQIAKVKVRLYTLGLRPKRKVVSIEIGIVEQGIILKKYQLTVVTELFKRREESVSE